ncbi:MAG TPA: TIM-barrel domain-containing protein [Verrucomicrobiae bacterium]|nr:TIM-barrel domain-containing protein [Verrucomicrobiae bacterium]
MEYSFFKPATLVLGLCSLCAVSFGAPDNVSKTEHGVLIQLRGQEIELAPAGPNALRFSVGTNHSSRPASSSFLIATNGAAPTAWNFVESGDYVGVETAAGKLLMNPRDGVWTLQAHDGKTLIPPHAFGGVDQPAAENSREVQVQLGWDGKDRVEVYGCGSADSNLERASARGEVSNGKAVIPYYWAKSGYCVLGVTEDDNRPARWRAAVNNEYLTWTFPGSRADLYLMPAASLKDAAKAYSQLTGAAPVPPRWAFGYLQSRWGWTNHLSIEDALKHFRDLKIPVDAFVYDFEWYTPKPDYELPDSGKDAFEDFGWNTNLFPQRAAEIQSEKAMGVHFVGIRKPRLGDAGLLKMVRAKKWDLASNVPNKVPARDLNFMDPNLREWYIGESANLLKSGVSGWWNDEGEATYTTYFYWNLAERVAMDRYRPNARLWTLNRAFSPGTQRFGAAVWTGDIVSSWQTFAGTPANLLNWGLSGMPYSTCDIGGFFGSPSPELMSRWMEAGVFFPIMRTHSEVHYQPHFPWLYGNEALGAIRKAIDLRYQLIPYYYSLAYEAFESGLPVMRPLVMEFPRDPKVANMTDEWLMGDSLLAAPLLQEGGKRSVYLPEGDWYVFGTNTVSKGGRSIEVTAALGDNPAYVHAGTILPLGPVIQHTSELPGGPLELQIYVGKNATFTLVEDDGQTQNYLKGDTRRTVFKWDDNKGKLEWTRTGNYSGPDVFKEMRVVMFDSRGNLETNCSLTASGSVQLRPEMDSNAGSRPATTSARILQ